MKTEKTFLFIVSMLLFAACTTREQTENTGAAQSPQITQTNTVTPSEYHAQKSSTDKLFVIEREMPGAGELTPPQLKKASQLSNHVVDSLGPQIKWIHSYVTADKVYCVYSSPNKELIQKHAAATGFPADKITEAGTVIDPRTAGDGE